MGKKFYELEAACQFESLDAFDIRVVLEYGFSVANTQNLENSENQHSSKASYVSVIAF